MKRKNYFWNTLGVLLQSAISPLLLVVVTRTNGIEAAGLFSFAFSVSLLLWALAMWGGRTYQVSDIEGEFQTRSYIMARILLAGLAIVSTAIFCVINQYDVYKTSLIFALVVFKLLESFADVLYGVLQVNDRLYVSGKSLVAKAVLGLVAFVVVDLSTHNLLVSVLGIVVVNMAIILTYDVIQTSKFERIIFPRQKVMEYVTEALAALKRCASVFVVMFLTMFSLNVPRYFIDQHSEIEAGYFGIIAMPITLIVLVFTFILQPNVVNLSKLYNEHKIVAFKKAVTNVLSLSVAIGIFVLLGTILVGAWALGVVFGVDFTAYNRPLVVIVLGGIASALVTVYLNVFVIMRKVAFSLIVLTVTNIILIPVAYIAVQNHGLFGGVVAFTVTNFIQLALIAIYFNLPKKNGSSVEPSAK